VVAQDVAREVAREMEQAVEERTREPRVPKEDGENERAAWDPLLEIEDLDIDEQEETEDLEAQVRALAAQIELDADKMVEFSERLLQNHRNRDNTAAEETSKVGRYAATLASAAAGIHVSDDFRAYMQGWPAEVSEAEGKARREAQLRAQYEFCATVARAADDEESAGAHSGPIFRVATGNSRGHLQIASEAKSATGNGLSPAALHRFREAIFIAADNLGDGAVAPVDFPVSSLRLIEVNNCELVALRAAMLFEQSQPESEMDPGAPDVADEA